MSIRHRNINYRLHSLCQRTGNYQKAAYDLFIETAFHFSVLYTVYQTYKLVRFSGVSINSGSVNKL